jgi:hypothetical protein
MQAMDWLWIIHPFLAVTVIYPLVGVVARLGLQTRQRRVQKAKLPPATGRDHSDWGQWLAAAVVVVVLIALAVVIASKALGSSERGAAALIALLLAWLGTLSALMALLRVHGAGLRLSFSLITWLGLLTLGAQPEVFRLSDNPLQPEFWQSHYWGGVLVCGLMLFNLAARPEILRQLRWRRLHIAANALAALLFISQGLSGTRDLLEIPLHWQQPFLYQCNWTERTCPSQSQ